MRRETEEQFWLRIFHEFEINDDIEFADIREKLLITKHTKSAKLVSDDQDEK